MDVVDRFEFAAALAGVAEQLVGRRLSEQRLLELARADRRRSHAADRHRDAAELAGGIRIGYLAVSEAPAALGSIEHRPDPQERPQGVESE